MADDKKSNDPLSWIGSSEPAPRTKQNDSEHARFEEEIVALTERVKVVEADLKRFKTETAKRLDLLEPNVQSLTLAEKEKPKSFWEWFFGPSD
jgi:hypothetical protein